MTLSHAATLLVWLALAVLTVGLMRRRRLWIAGRAATSQWRGLIAAPKRYLVDLHAVVARDRYMALTHMAVAGGITVLLLVTAVNYGLALYLPMLDGLIVLAAVVAVLGAIAVWHRRRDPPTRLSRGAWMRLPFTLAAYAAGWLLLAVLPMSTLGSAAGIFVAALILVGSLELAGGVGSSGPMKHAVTGLLHLAFHPRPERFQGSRAGRNASALEPLDLQQRELGVRTPRDFRWNQLLGFDACVQCGKCEAACPAFAAGQPLNPKKLIQDLVSGMAGTDDAGYAGSLHPQLPKRHTRVSPQHAIVPSLIDPRTLWSCTTCRACVQECPMLIEHVDAVIDLRRYQTLEVGDVPPQAAMALTNLRETETLSGVAREARYHWAVDLNVRKARPGGAVHYLLIAGEGAYDLRYQRTLRSLVKLLKSAGVDFAVLGSDERDCGDTARRLGDEATFQALARKNIETLRALDFQRILTPDPHVLHCLRNEYPALGGHYDVVHHTTLLAELARDRRLRFEKRARSERIAYHDPCYLARYNGEVDAPRALLRGLGYELTEMERSGVRGRCCGGGGGAPLSDIPGERRIPDIRMDDARAVSADIVSVACPGCTAMLEGVVGKRPEVLDVSELLASAVEQ